MQFDVMQLSDDGFKQFEQSPHVLINRKQKDVVGSVTGQPNYVGNWTVLHGIPNLSTMSVEHSIVNKGPSVYVPLIPVTFITEPKKQIDMVISSLMFGISSFILLNANIKKLERIVITYYLSERDIDKRVMYLGIAIEEQ